jgi:hypothetical protein
MHDTAESLRSHALRFQDVEKALSTREKLDLSDLDLSEIPASTIMTLPDTGCVIYQCDRACVYIVSLITHGVVDLWFPDIFMICRLSEGSICTSTTHGLVVVFNGLVELEYVVDFPSEQTSIIADVALKGRGQVQGMGLSDRPECRSRAGV